MAEPQETLVPQRTAEAVVSEALFSDVMQEQFRIALPKGIDAARLTRLAMTEIRRTPKLVTHCSRQSLYGSIMVAAQMGLEIGINGQCWIVPFGDEAQFMIGYRGMLDLAWRSDKLKSVEAKAVRGGDKLDYRYGTGRYLHHDKADSKARGEFTHAYAVIETVYGGEMFDVMDFDEIEEIRVKARSQNIWNSWYEEQAKKTVLRRLLKLAPCSTEMSRAITLDEQAELGIPQGLGDAINVTPPADNEVPEAPSVPEGENE